jgi:DNA replication protein DnaC
MNITQKMIGSLDLLELNICEVDQVAPAIIDIQAALNAWDGEQSLFFTGDTGTGKTRAMNALAKIAIANGMQVALLDFSTLCRRIRAAFDTKQPEQQLRDKYLELDVLFLDDLGLRSTATEYEYGVFYDILDGRLSNHLATVISSNKTRTLVAQGFDRRIASRLTLFTEITFTGPDRRTEGHQQK